MFGHVIISSQARREETSQTSKESNQANKSALSAATYETNTADANFF